jgi:hypothetical protein
VPKRIRAKRIIAEVSDEIFDIIKEEAKAQNITVRGLILRILLPEIKRRKELRGRK